MEWTSSLGTSGIGDMIDVIALLNVGDQVTYQVTLTIPEKHTNAFINVVSVTAEDNEDPIEACESCMDINYQKIPIVDGFTSNINMNSYVF